MKAIITGISGFVGQYLKEELESANYEVIGIERTQKGDIILGDVLDRDRIIQIISDIQPDVIIHLAGQPRVRYSWDNPIETIQLNTLSSLNILDAVSKLNKAVRTLFIGSSEQYGIVSITNNIVNEEMPTRPVNPYAISKQAQEDLVLSLARKRNLDVVLTRSFNHIGPRQKVGMVIPDFASSIAKIEKQLQEPVIKVGNLYLKRDFTDVRDVVIAYRLLIEKGQTGEIYNIGNGKSYSIKEMLDFMINLSPKKIDIEIDKNKFRPIEIPELISNNRKIYETCGWLPRINIKDTLEATLDYWRHKDEYNYKEI